MLKIRKNDTVEVIKGRDSGKKGRVLEVSSDGRRVLVEGLNLLKKHMRKTKQDQQGGIVSIESPISIANLMFFCKGCNSGVRVGFKLSADKTKERICKKCKGVI